MKVMFPDDGVRPPREVQVSYLKHLQKKWISYDVFGAHLPPGYGKTYICKAIQQVYGARAMVVSVSNQLLDQYKESYPDTNTIKGTKHYDNRESYLQAFRDARDTPSIANPMSYYFGVLAGRIDVPEVLIVDEAHRLYDSMYLAAQMDFSVNNLAIPTFNDTFELAEWVELTKEKCEQALPRVHKMDSKNQTTFYNTYERLSLLSELVRVGDHTFTYEYAYARIRGKNQKVLRIIPMDLSKDLFWPFLDAKKLILLSGTFTTYDLKFYSEHADYYTGAHLTRPENRVVKYLPNPEGFRKCPETIAKKIIQVWEAEGRPNTIVHVTYDLQAKLAEWLEGERIITHTKASKSTAIKQFKTDGGIFLASGCAEGVDLPDDLCRLVIVPVIQFPNRGDPLIRKRLASVGGQFRYSMDSMMTTVQQLGRGTRHADDKCKSYVFDPQFSLLYQQTFEYLPNDLNVEWKV